MLVIGTATNTVIATIGVGTQPYGVDFTPDGATEARKPVQLIPAGMKSGVLGEDYGLSPTPGPLSHMGPRFFMSNSIRCSIFYALPWRTDSKAVSDFLSSRINYGSPARTHI
ncbi:hypothetical protein [Streptosporangium subroseum]|uniref:hypothetical protein n=1 Tax=Streptosporangium subroseum TaxID=106412 RepID=UPI00308DEEF0|nr:hypothetical protein OHB15_50140 [Streptosporangium subroseum]